MKSLAGALANRWSAARAQVARRIPQRVVELYGRLDARLDSIAPPTVGSATADWVLASILLIAGPLLVASLLLAAVCGGGLWDCAPAWHDEMWYFNEMSVFAATGWTGGYTIGHELPARAEWNRFGVHGPFVPALYGLTARLTNMHLATIPLLHAILLVLGSVFWVASSRLNVRQSWIAALVAVTYWPLILYIPTSMQEGLHLSIAFVLAGLSLLLIRNRESKGLLVLTLLAIAAAAQARVTWSWIAVPVLWVAMQPQTARRMALLAACSLFFVLVFYLEAVVIVSPFPNFMRTVLNGATESPFTTCWLIFVHMLKGIEHYLAPNHDSILEIVFRYQTIFICGVAIYQLRQFYARRTAAADAEAMDRNVLTLEATGYTFALLTLVCIVGFVLALYDVRDWRDYRVVAPHMLLALLVMVGCNALDWLKRYAVFSTALFIVVVVQYAEFHRPRIAFDESQVAAFAETLDKVMPFEPGAPAWDNTMLTDMHYMNAPELLTLPGGIGISPVVKWEFQAWPPKSKYLLLDRELAEAVGIPPSMHKVAETRLGDIYMRR